MTLQIYNTKKRQKEVFEAINPERVTMYVCGPTVYNFVHIGNARPAVFFDVLARWLRRLHPEVVYARNITDIDDKINAAAKQNNESIQSLSQRFTKAFHEDMAALNVAKPTIEPFATEHVPEIIAIIERSWSTMVQTQQPNRLSPQLGVDLSITSGHSPSGEAP